MKTHDHYGEKGLVVAKAVIDDTRTQLAVQGSIIIIIFKYTPLRSISRRSPTESPVTN